MPQKIQFLFSFRNETVDETETKQISTAILSMYGGPSFPKGIIMKAAILCKRSQCKGGRGTRLKASSISTNSCLCQFRFTWI